MKTAIPSIVFFAFFTFGCSSPEAHSPNSGDTVVPMPNTETTLEEKQNQARFIVDSYEDTALFTPHSKISVEYNDSRTYLGDIPGVAEIQQGGNEAMEVPADAVASCGCWYAGGGDYFYIARSEKGITIYRGWLDEMQEDEGYHWQEMKNIE
jgi:hypothetical protein